ncbi:hypothetical protein ABMA57_15410 [Saccharospirillum sp. HFRX-1]|uniref:hypothetical protein n=1 Tax=unclassified Saccharospirillum TaxID=2633430 RepID=UPI003721F560
MSTPTWNPIDRLTSVILLLALIFLAVLAAPVAAPLLAGLLVAVALRSGRSDQPVSALQGMAWAGLGALLVLAAVYGAWPLLVKQSARADALLVSVDLAWLNWLLARAAVVSLAFLAWLLLLPAGFVLGWVGSHSVSAWLNRHRSSFLSRYQHWAEHLRGVLRVLMLQLGGRLLLFSLVFWLMGIEVWWLLAILLSLAALLPTLPLVLAVAVVWLSGPSPLMYGLLAVVAVIEAGMFSLAQRGPAWAQIKPASLLLVGVTLIVGVAAFGLVGVVLAIALLAALLAGFDDNKTLAGSTPVLTEASDPVDAIDESMRQEDS